MRLKYLADELGVAIMEDVPGEGAGNVADDGRNGRRLRESISVNHLDGRALP